MMMHDVLIRPAVLSERQALEALQRRASLNNPGDREALLANPDAIELPADGCAAVPAAARTRTYTASIEPAPRVLC